MTDFDQFERGLAAALRVDADESTSPISAAAVARAAIASHRRGPARLRWSARTMSYARFTVAAAVAIAVVGGAFYLFGPDRNTIGPSGPPEPTPSAAISASPSPIAPHGSAQPGKGSWTVTAGMIGARSRHTATLLPDGRVLIAGGDSNLDTAELYEPVSGTWTSTAKMTQARSGHTATLLPDGRVLVVGGDATDSAGPFTGPIRPILASAELYDPTTGTWTATGGMAAERIWHTATLLADGRVLVAGGAATLGALFAELYDPAPGTWTAAGDIAPERASHTATLLPDGRVLVAGGFGGGFGGDRLASAVLYDPIDGTWTATGRLPQAFGAHTATLLPDGSVLIAGGDAPSGPGARGFAHAAVYDDATEMWEATGDMLMARFEHAACLLPDGQVLVSGGRVHSGPESTEFTGAELYDPATGTWAPAVDMAVARSGHTATLLMDGHVLVAGGFTVGGSETASAELFVLDAAN